MTASTEAEITETIKNYYELIGSDVEAAANCYSEPAFVCQSLLFKVFALRSEIAAALEAGLANARQLGYAGTHPHIFAVRMLNDGTALASVLAVRRNSSGEEIERAGYTYVFQAGDGRWLIRCIIPTDVDKLEGK